MAIKEAVMTSVGHGTFGPKSVTAADIEQAMSNAVAECYSKGITNPDKVKAAKMVARKRVLEGYRTRTIGKRVLVSRTIIEEVADTSSEPIPRVTNRSWWKRILRIK